MKAETLASALTSNIGKVAQAGLTISAVIVPDHKASLPGRIERDLYKSFNWKTEKEKKWSEIKE